MMKYTYDIIHVYSIAVTSHGCISIVVAFAEDETRHEHRLATALFVYKQHIIRQQDFQTSYLQILRCRNRTVPEKYQNGSRRKMAVGEKTPPRDDVVFYGKVWAKCGNIWQQVGDSWTCCEKNV